MIALTQPADPHRPSYLEFWAFVYGYINLAGAYCKALNQDRPPASNAVPLADLRGWGMQEHHFLWMLFQMHVEHYQSAPGAASDTKAQPAQTLVLGGGSALVLTDRGWDFVGELLGELCARGEEGATTPARDGLLLGRLVPRYERADRLFCWGQHVLKHFLQPAGNQQIVLCAAEEQRWPWWFDDPLPKIPRTNPKVRLHDTIKDLNRRQTAQLIHFKGDGTGTRIGWEYH
jgi:hypothetical protein